MARPLRFCKKCNVYTLKQECCNSETLSPEPPKYSPEDKYGKYRREVKEKEYKEKGLI